MATPTPKAQGIEDVLNVFAPRDRRTAIHNNICVWCGKDVKGGFRDDLSAIEYGISGMCQPCQDEAFAEPEE